MKKFLTLVLMVLLLAVPQAKASFITTAYTTADGKFAFQCVYDDVAGTYVISLVTIDETNAIESGVLTLPVLDLTFVNYDGLGDDLLILNCNDYSVEDEIDMGTYGNQIKEIRIEAGWNIPDKFACHPDITTSVSSPTILEKVYIANTVTYVGKEAFAHNLYLEDIEFEEGGGPLEIRESAFLGASDGMSWISYLSNLNLPERLTEIGNTAFQGHDELKEIVLPSQIAHIGYGAFADCPIKNLIVKDPWNLTLTASPFEGCPIEHVEINAHPTEITPGEFIYSTAVTGHLLEGVSSEFDVVFLPQDGDYDVLGFGEACLSKSGVTNVVMPEKFVYIASRYPDFGIIVDEDAFRETTSLKSLDLSKCDVNNVEIHDRAFEMSSIEEIALGNHVSIIGAQAFAGSMLSGALELPEMIDVRTNAPMALELGSSAFNNTMMLRSAKIQCNLDANVLRDNVFSYSGIEEIGLPESLEHLDGYAFAYSHLKSIKLGANIKTLGESVFESCPLLASADLSETSLSVLPRYTFWGDVALTDLKLPKMDKWEEYSLSRIGVKSLEVNVGEMVTPVLDNCENLEEVSFTNSAMTALEQWSLYQLPKLKRVDFGEYIKELKEWSIYDCPAFDSLVVTANIDTISQDALYYYSGGYLKAVMFKATDFKPIENEWEAPFFYIDYNLYFDPSVKKLEKNVLAGGYIYNSLEISPDMVIDEDAFNGTGFEHLDWHYPTMSANPFRHSTIYDLTFTGIEDIPDAFWADVSISNLHLDGVVNIGAKAFEYCSISNPDYGFVTTIPASVQDIKDEAFYETGINTLKFEKGSTLNIGKRAFATTTSNFNTIITEWPKENIPSAAADAFDAPYDCEAVFLPDCDALTLTAYQNAEGWKNIKTKKWEGKTEYKYSFELVGNKFPIGENELLTWNVYIDDIKASNTFIGCSNSATIEIKDLCSNITFDHWEDGNTDNPRVITLSSDTVIRIYVNEYSETVNLSLSDPTLSDIFKIYAYPSIGDPSEAVEVSSVEVNDCGGGYMNVVIVNLDPEHYTFDGWYDVYNSTTTYDETLGWLSVAGEYEAQVSERYYNIGLYQAPYCTGPKCYNVTDDLLINGISVGIYGGNVTVPSTSDVTVEFMGLNIGTEKYIAKQWNDTYDQKLSEDNPYTFTPTGDITLYPVIKEAGKFAINAYANEDALGTVDMKVLNPLDEVWPLGSGFYFEGAKIELSATPKNSHFHFIKWSDEAKGNPHVVTVTEDLDYFAIFERDTFTVTAFTAISGVATIKGAGRYGWGTDAKLEYTLTDDHYYFESWSYGSVTNTSAVLELKDIQDNIEVSLNIKPKLYDIDVAADPIDGGTVSGGGSYEYGSMATLTAVPYTGWQFKKWSDDPYGDLYAYSRLVSVDGDASYTAEFEKIPVTITAVSADDDMGTVTGGGSFVYGDDVTLKAEAKEGYKFVQWKEDGVTDATRTFKATEDKTFTAEFEIIKVTITTKVNDEAMGSVTGAGTYNYGDDVTLKAEAKEGYKFVQWKEDAVTDATRTFKATEDKTFTAEFEIIKVTITTKVNDEAMGSVTGGGTFNYGEDVTLKAEAKEGYKFVQWKEDAVTDATRTFKATEDKTFTAEFEIIKVTITAKVNDEAMGSVTGGGTFNYGEDVTLKAEAKEGFEFVEWSEDGVKDATRTFKATEDKTLTAVFQKSIVYYNIEAVSENEIMGTVTGGGKYEENADVALYAVPKDGYKFVEWIENNSTDNPLKFKATADAKFTAKFASTAVKKFTITVESADEAMGTTTGTGEYAENTVIEIKAIPATGHKFVKWSDGNTDNPRSITVTEDKTFTAEFAVMQFTITAVSADDDKGTVSGGGIFDYGKKITLTATAKEGYEFVEWKEDGDKNNPRHLTVSEDATYTAVFQKATVYYNIEATPNDAEWGSVKGAGKYEEGAEVVLNALAAEGYQFVKWSNGSTDNPLIFNATADMKLTAVFELIPVVKKFTITALSSDDKLGSVTGSGEYEEGATVTLTAVPAEGCEFVQWNNGSKENPLVFTASENKTFVANFQKKAETKEYTITVKSNNDDWGTVKGGGTAKEGEKLTIEATAKEGYKFLQWNDGDKTNPREITVTKDETYTAQFAKEDAKTYVIEAAANNAEWGSVKGGGEYAEGAEVVLFAVAAEGYQFVEWSTGSKDNPLVFNATENASITAVFEAKPEEKKFTITAAAADDKTGSVTGGGEYAEGATATLTAIPATGYEFVQWNDGDKSNPRSITVTENKTFIATFKKIEDTPVMVTVTVQSADENMGMAYGTKTVEQGTPVSIAAVAKSGYKFLQWSDGSTENPRVVIAEKDILIIAQFAKEDAKTFKVSAVSANDEQGQVLGSGEYAENATATLIAVAKDGYKFSQWNDGNKDNPREVVVTGDMSFVALFETTSSEQQKYTITVLVNDEAMGTATGSGEYVEGQIATLVALPNAGYQFVQWNDGVKENLRYVTVTANTTYTATFEKIPEVEKTYTLTVISNDIKMGNVIGSGTYKENETVTIGALANSGYKFVRWNDGSTENPRVITVTEDKTFIAIFEKDGSEKQQYTITISSSDESMGTVQGAGEFTLDEGTVLVIVAQAKPDHHFVNWENGSTDVKRIITVTEDHAYIAFFEKNKPVVPTYIVTVLSADETMGTVSGTGAYAEGTVITIRAIANDGYEFDHWSDGSVEAVREISVTANAKFVATFRAKKNYFALNALSSNNSEGTVTGAGIYEEGSVVTIEAVPAEGYHFVQWSDGNTDNPRQVTVNDNITLIAIFASGSAVETLDAVRDQVRKVMIDGHVYMILPDGRTYDANGRQVK